MKNRKFIATLLTALMLFICSATAFAEDITVLEAEPSTITEVTEADTTDNATQANAAEESTDSDAEESATDENNEGVTVNREEVTLDNTEPSETEIVIDTSEVSITEGEPQNTIVVDFADTYTDIPNTGSNTAIEIAVLSAACLSVITLAIYKKANNTKMY